MLFDYLLYDNRTVGPTGRDWGLKVATGALAGDRQIRQHFVEYCSRSFKTNVRILRGFGAALGGFPTGSESYLLCVTLEVRDLYRRPACAFIGIHCTSRNLLLSLLEAADPFVTAWAVYGAEGLLGQLAAQGKPWLDSGSPPEVPKVVVHESGSRFGPFQRGGSPRAAGFILSKACRSGGRLPTILGIASWTSSKALAASPDQFIFYQYLPPSLAKQARVQPVEVKKAPPAAVPLAGGATQLRRKPFLLALIALVPLGLVGAVMLYLLPQPASPVEAPQPSLTPPPASVSPATSQASPEPKAVPKSRPGAGPGKFLDRMEPLVTALTELDPAHLRSSPIYGALLEVEVLPEHEEKRAAMIRLLEGELAEVQRSAIRARNIGYYFFDYRGKELADADRASQVRRILAEVQLPVEGCRLLHTTLAFWMRSSDSDPAAWCRVVEALSEEQRIIE